MKMTQSLKNQGANSRKRISDAIESLPPPHQPPPHPHGLRLYMTKQASIHLSGSWVTGGGERMGRGGGGGGEGKEGGRTMKRNEDMGGGRGRRDEDEDKEEDEEGGKTKDRNGSTMKEQRRHELKEKTTKKIYKSRTTLKRPSSLQLPGWIKTCKK